MVLRTHTQGENHGSMARRSYKHKKYLKQIKKGVGEGVKGLAAVGRRADQRAFGQLKFNTCKLFVTIATTFNTCDTLTYARARLTAGPRLVVRR